MSKKKQRRQSAQKNKQQGPSLLIPIIVGVVVVALVIGAIAFLENGRNSSAAQPSDGLAQENTAQALNTNAIPYPNVPRVSLEDTQDKLAQGQAILVDVRSKASYDKSHAEGAISVPEEEIEARKDELPRDKELILYCT
jgi:3-mercaptopyruvate sulfurtransferase SseA